jgi:hypothetical protein
LLTIALSSDGQVPLKQFIMDNPLHIPPDAAPSAECRSCQNCLAWSAKTIFGLFFQQENLLRIRHKSFGRPLQLWSLDWTRKEEPRIKLLSLRAWDCYVTDIQTCLVNETC